MKDLSSQILERANKLYSNLSNDQKRWFQTIADLSDGVRHVDAARAMALLDGEIATDFEPREIPSELLRSGRLTCLGYLVVEESTNLIDQMEDLAYAVRSAVIEAAKEKQISSNGRLNVTETIQGLDWKTERFRIVENCLGSSGFRVSISVNDEQDPTTYELMDPKRTFWDLYPLQGDFTERVFEYYFPASNPAPEAEEDEEQRTRPATINPIFKSRIYEVVEGHGFVIMPFGQKWSDYIWTGVIRKTLEPHGYNLRRADDGMGREIMEDVWREINRSEFIIADITGCNPNVMYELGIADTVGKPIIALTQDSPSDLPFDVSSYRVIEYDSDVGGDADLKSNLHDAVKEAIKAFEEKHQHNKRQNIQPPPLAYSPTGRFGFR
jgi:hypothetical protein